MIQVLLKKNLYILDENLFSYHYYFDEYINIFIRRTERFLYLIKNSDNIIFIRINPYNKNTSDEEINIFYNAIYSINSKLNIKFLLINTINKNLIF